MRRLTILLLLMTFAVALRAAAKDETVDELKSRFASARPEDRPELAVRIAQHQLRDADKLYADGKVESARAAVEDIASYSEKARDAAIETKKRLKNVEIDVRKMAENCVTSNALSPSKIRLRWKRPSVAWKTPHHTAQGNVHRQ